MASSRTAWGIDVGNRALKAVKLVRDGDGFRVDDFDVIEHETPLDQSGDNRESLIAKSLDAFASRHKLGKTPVGVAVSGNQAFAKFIKLPPVEEKKIPEIVKFEAIQQIPFPLDDVEWQYQLFKKSDDPEIEVGIFAMRKDLVNHYVSAYTDRKLQVQVVQMSAMAVYNALFHDGKLDGPTLILDVGAATTDLLIADGEQVWHRSIPIGGNNFTEALVRMFSGKKTFAEAEEMKREASTHKYARQIFQAMRPVFGDLVAEVQRSVGFYQSTHPSVKVGKAIALGGTLKLPGLQKYLQQNLSLDVQALDAFAATAPSDPKLAGQYEESAIAAVTAYGLALQAAGDAKVATSLLPGHIRTTMMWQEKTKWFAASAALVVLGAGVAFAGAYLPGMSFDSSEQREARERIDGAVREAKAADAAWAKVEGDGETERTTVRNMLSLAHDRAVWAEIVGMIHASVPVRPEKESGERSQREWLKVDQWQSFYVPSIGPLLGDAKRAKYWSEQPQAPVAEGGAQGPALSSGMTWNRFGSANQVIPFGATTGNVDVIDVPEVPKEIVTAAGTNTPGFVIRVVGVTPNANVYELLRKTMFGKLLATRIGSEKAARPFYVADAILVRQSKIKDDTTRLTDMTRSWTEANKLKPVPPPATDGSAPGSGGGQGGTVNGGVPDGGGSVTPDDPRPFYDPQRLPAQEDRRQDNEFAALLFVVVGNPPPPAPPAAAPEAPKP